MSRPTGTDEKPNNQELQARVEHLELLVKKLLPVLLKAESQIQAAAKDKNIYLIPTGEWLGTKYE